MAITQDGFVLIGSDLSLQGLSGQNPHSDLLGVCRNLRSFILTEASVALLTFARETTI